MQLHHYKTIIAPRSEIQPISAIAWSLNNLKLAVGNADRVVYLFDDQGDRKDKFKTKPLDANVTAVYSIRALAFSPDATLLAIAQSDQCVFVYRLGAEWGEKKAICNKFHCSAGVTCLCWPYVENDFLLYGGADGSIRIAVVSTNRSLHIYSHPQGFPMVSIHFTASRIITVFLDGSVHMAEHNDGEKHVFKPLLHHHCVPLATGLGKSILIIGTDGKMVFYTLLGVKMIEFEGGGELSTTVAFNPSGDAAIVGGRHKLTIFSYDNVNNYWNRASEKTIENLHTICSLVWKEDGSKIIAGTISGAVELFDIYLRKTIQRNAFEFTHISPSSVIVKTLATGSRLVLKSTPGYEITKTKIYKDRFIVAHTPETLLVGNLETHMLSEIEWQGDSERFHFNNDEACVLYCHGELHVIQFGCNSFCGVVSSAYFSTCCVSLVVGDEMKRIAFLIDAKTIQIYDLVRKQEIRNVQHNKRIDWIALSDDGHQLLFRDRKCSLFLINVMKTTQQQQSDVCNECIALLMENCRYAQWVPNSESIVAQKERDIVVWYDSNDLEARKVYRNKSSNRVVGIERHESKTEIITNGESGVGCIHLDENLIEFKRALERLEFNKCLVLTESLETDNNAIDQWKRIADVCLSKQALSNVTKREEAIKTAIRCSTAVGDHSRAQYLQQVADRAGIDGYGSDETLLRLLLLKQDWHKAESLILKQNATADLLIDICKAMNKWPNAIRVAKNCRPAQLEDLRREYISWLIETAQHDKAAMIKEKERDYTEAISFYVNGGFSFKAAKLLLNCNTYIDENLVSAMLKSLKEKALYEMAGDVLRHLQRFAEAKDMYEKAQNYRKLAELCRRYDPESLVDIEHKWGDHLFRSNNFEAAIERYVQSGHTKKAINSAILANKLDKAAELLQDMEGDAFSELHIKLALSFKNTQRWKQAEQHYIKGKRPMEAVAMYRILGEWDKAHVIAETYIPPLELTAFYLDLAAELEVEGDYETAEKVYIRVEGGDQAVMDMYKKHKEYQLLLKFVKSYQKSSIDETYTYIGNQLRDERQFKEAEKYYLCCNNVSAIIAMYKSEGLWEDAFHVASAHSDASVIQEVAQSAVSLTEIRDAASGIENDIVHGAIDYALKARLFEEAQNIAENLAVDRLLEVHHNWASVLRENGLALEAEAHFISAGESDTAIDMYLQSNQWQEAQRVAENYKPTRLGEINAKHAQHCQQSGDYPAAEILFLEAKTPELAVQMYKEAQMFDDALRLAAQYTPSLMSDIHLSLAESAKFPTTATPYSDEAVAGVLEKAKAYEKGCNYCKAADLYLNLNSNATQNHDLLQEIWSHAVQLCAKHLPEKSAEVAAVVASRLVQLNRHTAAAEIYLSLNDLKGAVSVYCSAGLFKEALQTCGCNKTLTDFVFDCREKSLVQTEDIDGLIAQGSFAKALDLLMARKDWDRVHAIAKNTEEEIQQRYSTLHMLEAWEQGDVLKALEIGVLHGVSLDSTFFAFYKSLALHVIRSRDSEQEAEEICHLVVILQNIAEGETSTDHKMPLLPYLTVVRWMYIMNLSVKAGLPMIAAMQSLVLLKHLSLLPADKAFYLSGILCREAGRLNMAFVFLNRYLDIVDAMEEGETHASLENRSFSKTDISVVTEVPKTQYVDKEKREAVRDWILATSMDSNVSNTLDTAPCEQCHEETYIGNVVCHSCKAERQTCVVTGLPIRSQSRYCDRDDPRIIVNKEDWIVWKRQVGFCPLTNNKL